MGKAPGALATGRAPVGAAAVGVGLQRMVDGARSTPRASMKYLIWNDPDGGMVYLTTDSPAGSHGVPVLEVRAGTLDGIYWPSAPLYEKGAGSMTAASLVKAWADSSDRSDAEIEAARRFCAQWPEGPQVESRSSGGSERGQPWLRRVCTPLSIPPRSPGLPPRQRALSALHRQSRPPRHHRPKQQPGQTTILHQEPAKVGTEPHLLPVAVFPTLVSAPCTAFPEPAERPGRACGCGPPPAAGRELEGRYDRYAGHRPALTVTGWLPTGGKAVGSPGTRQGAAGTPG